MKEYLKLSEEEREALHNNFLQEPDAYYQKAEMDQLRAALKRTYKERFLVMTSLMKKSIMFKNAKITHQPLLPTDRA
ncbi:MAG: hypothetical protein ABL876_11435 [Chitinophagaceae bacterium]